MIFISYAVFLDKVESTCVLRVHSKLEGICLKEKHFPFVDKQVDPQSVVLADINLDSIIDSCNKLRILKTKNDTTASLCQYNSRSINIRKENGGRPQIETTRIHLSDPQLSITQPKKLQFQDPSGFIKETLEIRSEGSHLGTWDFISKSRYPT